MAASSLPEKNGLVRVARDDGVAAEPVLDFRASTRGTSAGSSRSPSIHNLRRIGRLRRLLGPTKRRTCEAPASSASRDSHSPDLARSRARDRRRRGRSCQGLSRACRRPLTASRPGRPHRGGHRVREGWQASMSRPATGAARSAWKSVRSRPDVDDLGGKVLRVTRAGRGLPTNPFFDGDAANDRRSGRSGSGTRFG